MDTLIYLVRDLVIVAVIASFCEMLLPESGIKKPVRLIFSLYFMALLLNPVVSLWTETDFAAMDFRALGEEEVMAVEEEDIRAGVYETAAADLAAEIEAKLTAIYDNCCFGVEIDMSEDGFDCVSVQVIYGGSLEQRVVAAEIQSLLASDYGIEREITKIGFERG